VHDTCNLYFLRNLHTVAGAPPCRVPARTVVGLQRIYVSTSKRALERLFRRHFGANPRIVLNNAQFELGRNRNVPHPAFSSWGR
jgi:hypothetical protein